MEARLQPSSGEPKTVGIRSTQGASILGIFTGQGAQWARMGVKLIESYELARRTIEKLDQSLEALPAADRPGFKIFDELSADKSSSRLGESIFSQTLCTAVQIVLVDLLQSAGIVFKAVVGHSVG
jgi:hybrid polyketide synthase/nonribosomal peptide synthetase ACE1